MGKLKRFFSCFAAMALMFCCVQFSYAKNDEILLTVNGKSFTNRSTVNDFYAVYGTEKLKTESIFGGYAYTFHGDNYSNYLYIETNSEGFVTSYCTFGNNFTSDAGDFGDEDTGYFSSLSGNTYTNDNVIWGLTGYCAQNISDKSAPTARYNSDAKYAESIARHAVIMWNAVSVYFGRTSNMEFDSRTFYMNRQLMEGGSNFYDYCDNIGKQSQFQLITCSKYMPYMLERGAYYPNPGMYACYSRNYVMPSNSYPVFDCNGSGGYIIGSLRDTFYDSWNSVLYTEEEITLLERARSIYMGSVEIFNSEEEYFEIRPQDSVLPLEPGKISLSKLQGALGYINAIRAGAGLPLFELSEDLSKGCQYKAILTSYLSKNNISNPSPHFPPQVDGISDEYYALAQSGSGENLYHGNVITSITNALNDAYGDPITCGHRYNLLNPNWKYIGFGSTEVEGNISYGIQGVHKMSGYQTCNAEIVAWPSKGVMLEEAGAGSNTMYTAMFIDNYSLTDNTGVVFKCLNNGETYEFISGQSNTDDHQLYKSSGIVSYYDRNISMTVGNVYEITLTNVKDNSTGEILDYTYRSVYEKAYVETASEGASVINISSSYITLAVNQRTKISASVIPEDCSNKMIAWSSDNTDVATVNENGYVTAHRNGYATIIARADNGVVNTCTVYVHNTPFTDLTSKWYIPYIENAYQCGIMSGMTPTTFEPSTGMSRAMFVKVLANLEGIELDNNAPTAFQDVSVGRYYTGPIAWASKNGIVNGISSTVFSPNSPITREQMCAMLIRYVKFKNIVLDQSVTPVTFEDENKISNYAKEYVKICQKAGFINGMTPTTFEPKGNATRAQVAKIFSVFYDYIG